MATTRNYDWQAAGDARALSIAALESTGQWVARLAPFSSFVTLTHRPILAGAAQAVTSRSHRSGSGAYTRVGLRRHNSMVRDWFYDDVRGVDPTARLWGETELHANGQPHEHALLALAESAPLFQCMQAWYDRPDGGIWNAQPFSQDPDELVRAAAYVEKAAKYAGKLACQPPKILGFGLLPAPSFARVLLVDAIRSGSSEAR